MKTLFLAFTVGCLVGMAAGPNYTVTVNGQPSTLQLVGETLTLTFPLDDHRSEWTVTLEKDDAARTLAVGMLPKKRKMRGDTDCYWCGASGKCAQDSPTGSGGNFQGQAEYNCNGTGKCQHCNGSGKL